MTDRVTTRDDSRGCSGVLAAFYVLVGCGRFFSLEFV
jgi:hypothetical protein